MSVEKVVSMYRDRIGEKINVGPWLEIDQERIDRFAEVTRDEQWIHVDPERAKEDSPYGKTVAHGFLTLSLLPYLTQSNQPGKFEENYPGMRLRVNYGVNKVRFPAPVVVGSRIRAHTQVLDAEEAGKAAQIIYKITVEIEGEEKPACVAEQVVRVFP